MCCSPCFKTYLTTKRAKSVATALITNGVEEQRVHYRGYGARACSRGLPHRANTRVAASDDFEATSCCSTDWRAAACGWHQAPGTRGTRQARPGTAG